MRNKRPQSRFFLSATVSIRFQLAEQNKVTSFETWSCLTSATFLSISRSTSRNTNSWKTGLWKNFCLKIVVMIMNWTLGCFELLSYARNKTTFVAVSHSCRSESWLLATKKAPTRYFYKNNFWRLLQRERERERELQREQGMIKTLVFPAFCPSPRQPSQTCTHTHPHSHSHAIPQAPLYPSHSLYLSSMEREHSSEGSRIKNLQWSVCFYF